MNINRVLGGLTAITLILLMFKLNGFLFDSLLNSTNIKNRYFLTNNKNTDYELQLEINSPNHVKAYDKYKLRATLDMKELIKFISELNGNTNREAERFKIFMLNVLTKRLYCNIYHDKVMNAITIGIFRSIPSHIFFLGEGKIELYNDNFFEDLRNIYNMIIDKPKSSINSMKALLALNYYALLSPLLFCLYDNCIVGYFNKFPTIVIIIDKLDLMIAAKDISKLNDIIIYAIFFYMAKFGDDYAIGKIITPNSEIFTRLNPNKNALSIKKIFNLFFSKQIPPNILAFMATFDFTKMHTELEIGNVDEICENYKKMIEHPKTTFVCMQNSYPTL